MSILFELAPLIIFFIFYKFYDLYWATGALITATFLQVLIAYLRHGTVEKKLLISGAAIVAFGGLTLALRDERFIMWKPSVIYMIFALALIISQVFFNRPILKSMLGGFFKVPEPIWLKLAIAWSLLFISLAGANLYVAFNFDQDTWVNFKVFGMSIITLVMTLGTIAYLYSNMSEEDKQAFHKEEDTNE